MALIFKKRKHLEHKNNTHSELNQFKHKILMYCMISKVNATMSITDHVKCAFNIADKKYVFTTKLNDKHKINITL